MTTSVPPPGFPRNATDRTILALEAFLPYRLTRLTDAISRKFSQAYRARLGLTRPEWRTLATLGQFGTMTATDIGTHSSMHKTKVSRAVASLEERRWLLREPDAQDRRVERLTLSRVGQKAYEDMVPVAHGFETRLLARMKPEERAALLTGLEALERAALED
ncbi:MarR family transcriptional regulator [Nitratireductor aquimarinus]|uniref:MarR family winged helix-turn-helix transcriptional regulator n=1 Tax=Nitratireductor TaxID=245876 RepID=UPI0019D3C347|nr:MULTISPECIES: MarR family transcriptional regulator [Nitratireductor]MBN7776034.1 MarR family transcriptional regulator [Nitratireductor pacificus]MBN7780698.1 MarR family transcriptional regulator [Nitratireductor pacificus]MBN7789504.1 MarR family transcriptional regulator [Nitratireductor aquimarinus]MBY6098782.1 MarR family transcriptional regulator [Nitratireductor aquimarinus]MCA1262471.1 MarR family transcriptional regulator [Nitratireductor aquimarinus]